MMPWVTYAELANRRGIARTSAIKLVRRSGWQRRQIGDGTARTAVLVPSDVLEAQARDGRAVAALRKEVARLARLDAGPTG